MSPCNASASIARRLMFLFGCSAVVVLLGACSLIETTVDLPFRAVKAVIPGGVETLPVDPIDLQEDMLRFADNFVLSTSKAAEQLMSNGQPIKRQELLTIKVALSSDVYGLASGSNALANLVGLTVLSSGARWRVEDYWLPKVYGASAEPMLKTLRAREEEIWEISKRVLKPEMIEDLKTAIAQWRKTSGDPQGDLEAFASNSLVNEVTKGFSNTRASSNTSYVPSSVFALLDIDPLSGLDPATRELTETRLFAERALFMSQRLPQLIEWQLELLAMGAASIPQVNKLADGADQLGNSSERISHLLEQFPGILSHEREKIIEALRSERQGLETLSRSLGETMAQGSVMALNVDQAFKSFDGLLGHIREWPEDPNSRPFDINEYGKTAHEITEMATQINLLIGQLNKEHNMASATPVRSANSEAIRSIIDYAFKKLMLLIALITLLVVAGRLSYLWIVNRWRSQGHFH